MAVLTDLLQQLGLLSAPTVGAPPATAQAVLSWPPPQFTVLAGQVSSTRGDLDRTTSPRPRVVAFIGPETTTRGLGAEVHRWLSTVPNPGGLGLDPISVSRAVLAYHREDLELDELALAPPSKGFPAWEVGLGVRLPIELDDSGRPRTDLAYWASLASTADPAWDAVLDWVPWTLEVPEHDIDQQWARDAVAAAQDRATLADDLRAMVLLNPSKAVYRILAMLAVDATSPSARQEQLWTALVVTSSSPDELALLATTNPGAVVLRAVYRRLAALATTAPAPSVDQAVERLNAALGLPPGPIAWDLAQNNPTTVPRELPVSTSWSRRADSARRPRFDLNGERTDGRHELVLGRSFYAGRWLDDGMYYGPAYVGNAAYAVGAYVAAHRAAVFEGAGATRRARLDVVAAIAGNEGFLDAVRLRDMGILSLGVQQWTVHVNNELNVLLSDLAASEPDDYDTHFGIYGLRVTPTDTWAAQPPGMPPGSTKAATMGLAGSGTQVTPMVAPNPAPDHPPERLHFFGGAADPRAAGRFRFDDTPWSGRVRSATRSSRALQLRELHVAADRFGRIRAEDRTWTVGAATFRIEQLVTSVQGAAQVLDQHINAPGRLTADVTTGVAKTNATPATEANGELTTAWLTAFETQYLAAVRYGSGITKTDTTLPNGKVLHGRQSYILQQGLSSAPHSFQGW